jgi:DNA-directed RNA polymerase subunit M/transcription elongation factor TFIIS
MEFCPVCNNLLYFTTAEGTVQKYCKNCDYKSNTEDTILDKTNSLIYERHIKEQPINYDFIVNDYTKNDPTLPRNENIICPNQNCKSNNKNNPEKRDVRYIKYDEERMKFIYICAVCDTRWRSTHN